MNLTNRQPVYNLQAVMRETGIKADTLRIWEKRYGIPTPLRSAGGQRLYSRYDIELIRWLMQRQQSGLRISQAVEQWQILLQSGQDPLAEVNNPPQPILSQPELSLDELREGWLQSCRAFDAPAAEEWLNRAFACYPLENVCEEVLQEGLRLLGEGWYNGRVSVQQEHFASAVALRRVEALISAQPQPVRKQTVLLACAGEEWHTFPLLLINLYLRRRGLNVIYLGANTPSQEMLETVRTLKPDLTVLVAQRLVSAVPLSSLMVQLQTAGFQGAYGGWIFNQNAALCRTIPAHYLGQEIKQAAEKIDHLCVHPVAAPAALVVSDQMRWLRLKFSRSRVLIESHVLQAPELAQMPPAQIETANHYFGDELAAALELGDVSLMNTDMDWISQMMVHSNHHNHLLEPYLLVYCRALEKYLGSEADVVLDWAQNWFASVELSSVV